VIRDVLNATNVRQSAGGPPNRPFITLSYAQSLDGSIAGSDGHPLALSSPPSLFRTHSLRARHDGLLVGVGTVRTDDPQLTVRHAPGPSPQPIVLDTDLRTPSSAQIFQNARPPWFVAGLPVSPARRAPLVAMGCRVFEEPRAEHGHVDLHSALGALHAAGLRSVMVEGGARLLRAFLEARLVDWLVITIAPRFVAGKPALPPGPGSLPEMRFHGWEPSGPDLIVWGELE
jgi:GTP cyclohydrolase II